MNRLARACTIAVWAGVLCAAAAPVCAQPAAPAASLHLTRTADVLFADATAKEAAVRKVLAAATPQATLLKAVRTVVADYEGLVRQYPSSGYCDDALWRAASLARDAFERFGEAREREASLRLLKFLGSEYPTSKFARSAPEQVAWLNAHPARPGPATASTRTGPAPRPAATPPVVSAQAPVTKAARVPVPASARPTKLVNIKAIRRAVMKDVVRVIIELDDEVLFHDERLDGPARVFVDLQSTRANPALIDQTLRFDADTDLVRQIRIGRHPNAVTRVVLEASGVSSYSVYPLYSPYRLVIDCLRPAPMVADSTAAQPSSGDTLTTPAVAAPLPPATPVSIGSPALGAASVALVELAPAPSLPLVPVPAPGVAGEGTTPATGPAPNADLPAWASTLKKDPSVLASRRVRWILPMPAGAVVLLPSVALPDTPQAAASLPPSAPAHAAGAPAPPAPPSTNLAGGLSIARQLGLGVSRIVIDPGHGGHDPGAKGGGVREAELVLDVALRLERLLARLPGVEVVLTRRENQFITLQERTAIANRENADLFLSIHANASSVASARGVETYFLNFAKTRSAAAVAARENATSGQTMGSLQDVVQAIALNSKVDESRDFATYVQREMMSRLKSSNRGLKDLGVKQAPFVVLIGAAMPSVLAEISFITNPQEAKLLKGTNYRQRIAEALFEGVKKYQTSLKNVSAVAAQQQN